MLDRVHNPEHLSDKVPYDVELCIMIYLQPIIWKLKIESCYSLIKFIIYLYKVNCISNDFDWIAKQHNYINAYMYVIKKVSTHLQWW